MGATWSPITVKRKDIYPKIFWKEPNKSLYEKDKKQIPGWADPRGVLPSGITPNNLMGYKIAISTDRDPVFYPELLSFNNPGLGGGINFNAFITNMTYVKYRISCAHSLVFFEGKDVIDLPTSNLEYKDGGFVVPQKVFYPIYAGDEKFIGPKDSIETKSTQEYLSRSSTNKVLGMASSSPPPLDSLSNKDNIFNYSSFGKTDNLILDSASNIIKVDGRPKYLTYVAIDKPLFREVIWSYTGIEVVGISVLGRLVIDTIYPSNISKISVVACRYAYVRINSENDKTPIYQWKLAESFGIKPLKLMKNPSEMLKEEKELAYLITDDVNLHYAYDLKDNSKEISAGYPFPKIDKTAYSILLATKMSDESSKYYDANKKFVILPRKQKYSYNGEIDINFASAVPSETDRSIDMAVEAEYLSPFISSQFNSNLRVGVEYSLRRSREGAWARMKSGGVLKSESTISVFSQKNEIAISAYYDACSRCTFLITSENGISERSFGDDLWTIDKVEIPKSKKNAFLIGESLSKSSGVVAIRSKHEKLDTPINGEKGNISINSEYCPTAIALSCSQGSNKKGVLQLYNSNMLSEPIFETTIPDLNSDSIIIPIASSNFGAYNLENSSGVSLTGLYGTKKKGFLQSLKGSSTALKGFSVNLSVAQLNTIGEQSFPISSNSVSATAINKLGYSFLAYETEGRIDIAFRPSHGTGFWPVRDICFRAPKDESLKTLNFPSVSKPFLLSNISTNSVYLFYEYKNRVLIKTIPSEIFIQAKSPGANGTYPIETEIEISEIIKNSIPSIIYDGGLSVKEDGGNAKKDIELDIKNGIIKYIDDHIPYGWNNTDASIQNISACILTGNRILCFIQDGNRIYVSRSTDSGTNWSMALGKDFTFLPPIKKNGKIIDDESARYDGSMPSCFYSDGFKSILLFYVVDGALLFESIPSELFFSKSFEEAEDEIKKIIPNVIYGKVSDNLSTRGIVASPAVQRRQIEAQKDFSETLPDQRVAVVRTKTGHLRVFFKNEKNNMSSLISSDSGTNWLSEKQYIEGI